MAQVVVSLKGSSEMAVLACLVETINFRYSCGLCCRKGWSTLFNLFAHEMQAVQHIAEA